MTHTTENRPLDSRDEMILMLLAALIQALALAAISI